MRFTPLGSGSQGNAALVEFGSTAGLVDAGLSCRSLENRLHSIGVPSRRIEWILLTHEHQDHARGVERFSRRHRIPVICSVATLEALDLSPSHFAAWTALPEDGRLDLGPVLVEAFPVPHDAVRPVGFILHGDGLRVGVATDLGHATTLVAQRLRGCNLIMVEANHDPELLRAGPYPWQLKQRVAGRLGHLSNDEAASLLARAIDAQCRAVILAHLSRENNRPALARQAVSRALFTEGLKRVEMRIALPGAPTPAVEL